MQTLNSVALVLTILFLCGVNYSESVFVSDAEWTQYKMTFDKSYMTTTQELNARSNFAFNSALIRNHNKLADKGYYSYTLAVNQFTDMSYCILTSDALFPETTQLFNNNASPLPILPNLPSPDTFHPRDVVNDYVPTVRDQGVRCSSGWAYATATSIASRISMISGLNAPELSAQQLIDCAPVGADGCFGQVPETAFDYLTKYGIPLSSKMDYPDDNLSPTMLPCRLVLGGGTPLAEYSHIPDGEEEMLKAYVSTLYPVVIAFNPTSFEFMQYKSGIFTQPATKNGSHYMVVLGYDKDSWLIQNSFGTSWGEAGFMRLRRNDINAKLPKSATLPTSWE